jgi:pantoate--beta-alanine ligase
VPVQIIKTIKEMQGVADRFRLDSKKIAIVPTMGYLHRGHTSLIEHVRPIADVVITTIFVNPTQFGPNEDFNRYPRDFDHDSAVAGKAGTDIIFYPDVKEMYPDGFNSHVEMECASDILEGEFRPKHFRGVTTIVAKLFNIVKPHIAIFGQKDAQQAFIIKKMAKDLDYDIQIIIAPIIREPDGLAMSSRNVYLNEVERKKALVLFQSLQHVKKRINQGEFSIELMKREMLEIIQSVSPTKIDYIAFINPKLFSEINSFQEGEILIALAVRFGTTRLIDNIIVPTKKLENEK